MKYLPTPSKQNLPGQFLEPQSPGRSPDPSSNSESPPRIGSALQNRRQYVRRYTVGGDPDLVGHNRYPSSALNWLSPGWNGIFQAGVYWDASESGASGLDECFREQQGQQSTDAESGENERGPPWEPTLRRRPTSPFEPWGVPARLDGKTKTMDAIVLPSLPAHSPTRGEKSRNSAHSR